MRRRQAFAKSEPVKKTDIREVYTKVFGKPPHHRMKPETILEKLNDAGHISA